jgi:hypothetical protein
VRHRVEGHAHHQGGGLPFGDQARDGGKARGAFGGHRLQRLRLAQPGVAGGHADTTGAEIEGQ